MLHSRIYLRSFLTGHTITTQFTLTHLPTVTT